MMIFIYVLGMFFTLGFNKEKPVTAVAAVVVWPLYLGIQFSEIVEELLSEKVVHEVVNMEVK